MAEPMTAEDAVRRVAGRPVRDRDGLRRLVIVLDGLAEGLTTAHEVADFFDDLAADWSAHPADRWFDAWERVCRGTGSVARRQAGYLRTAPAQVQLPPLPLTTTVRELDWRRYHLRPKTQQLSDEGFAFPEFPLPRDPSSVDRFRAMTARPGWYATPADTSGAWLGRPAAQRASCWVSTQRVAPHEPHEPWPSDAAGALSALGLPPANPGESCVRYQLDAGRLAAAGHGTGVRPGFADLGSSWFRIRAAGAGADRHRRHGWGSTMKLARDGRPIEEATGLPERVISSVPLDSPAVVGAELLLPADPQAPEPPPSQEEFDRMLMRGRKPADIVRQVVSALRRARATPAGA